MTHRVATIAATVTFLEASVSDSVAPATYSDTLAVGESVTIHKTVTVDAGLPDSAKIDVFFLPDTTGSMSGQIAAAKANAGTIIDDLSSLGDVWFGAGNCGDTTDPVFTYRQDAALTGVKADVPSGINAAAAGQANRIAAATGGEVFTLSSSGDGIADLIKAAVEGAFSEHSSVSLEAVGDPPGVGVSVSDPIPGDFDRDETRTFGFDVTFSGVVAGSYDFVINALVDGGIIATETDGIVVGAGSGDPDPDPCRSRCPRGCRFRSARPAVAVS